MKKNEDPFLTYLHLSFVTGAITGDYYRAVVKKYNDTRPTALRVVAGEGTTHWYQCNKCLCAVDGDDTFCKGCGSRLDGE